MAAPRFQHILRAMRIAFQELGYSGELVQDNYVFADVLGPEYKTKRIPLALFAQAPPSYRNAAFGVARANGLSGAQLVDDLKSLGAPQILEVTADEVRRWMVWGSDTAELIDRVNAIDIADYVHDHQDSWSPPAVLRAKLSEPGATQLDFVDAGLLPLLDAEVRTKLDVLLKDALWAAKDEYGTRHAFLEEHYPPLYRLVFRLVAAKLLSDRGHPGEWNSSEASVAIRAIEDFYFPGSSKEGIIEDSSTQQVIWDRIRQGFHFENLSVDALAHVYEDTLVSVDARRDYGIHGTPSHVARFIVQRLPLEQLEAEDRYVLEPFAGHSVFLVAAMQRLRELLPPSVDSSSRHEYFVNRLTGIELDPFAREVAKLSLMLADYPNPDGWRLFEGDVFDFGEFEAELRRCNIVLCNPPYGDFSREERLRYPDTSFVGKPAEILWRVLQSPPALLGFVLPRSFLSGRGFRPIRSRLVDCYGQLELLLLPDAVFRHSDVETVLVLASEVNSKLRRVRTGEVEESDVQAFKDRGKVSFSETIEGDEASDETCWQPQRFRTIWRTLRPLPTLGDFVKIHRGIEYNVSLRDNRDRLISSVPRDGFVPGVCDTAGSLEAYGIKRFDYLSVEPQMLRGNAIGHPWGSPKIFVNSARRSRGVWSLVAGIDSMGLVGYQNMHAVWPTSTLPLNVAAAVLNGIVANAHVAAHEGKRDVLVSTLKRIPVPRFDDLILEQIDTRVAELQRHQNVARHNTDFDGKMNRYFASAFRTIDALVLRAYGLPSALEDSLLRYFSRFENHAFVSPYIEDTFAIDSQLIGAYGLAHVPSDLVHRPSWEDDVREAVIAYGYQAIDLLRRSIESGVIRGEVLGATLSAIGDCDDATSAGPGLQLLEWALNSIKENDRSHAIAALRDLGSSDALELLQRAAELESIPRLQSQIAEAQAHLRARINFQ